VDVASGDIWVGAVLLPRPIQSDPRLWQPVPATVSGVPSQRCWYSELYEKRLLPYYKTILANSSPDGDLEP